MPLRMLIDEDSQGHRLVELLREHGHDVRTATEEGLIGMPDRQVFALAQSLSRVVLTHNCIDYKEIAKQFSKNHYGVLLVYQEKDVTRNMNAPEIARAVQNLEASGLNLTNQTIPLNHYRYSRTVD